MKKRIVSFNLSKRLDERISNISEKYGVSKSELAELALWEYLKSDSLGTQLQIAHVKKNWRDKEK